MKTIDNFRDLRELVASLETIEVKAARKFIDSFDSTLNQRTNKSLKLYNLLVKYPNIDKNKAKNKVSRETDERSFEKLHTRLYEKILDSLLLNINITRQGLYSESHKNRFLVRKKLMQASILKGRGLDKKSYYYVRKAIKKSRELELYDELIEGLYEKKWFLALELQYDGLAKVDKELVEVLEIRDTLLKAKDRYASYLINSNRADLEDDYRATLLEAITDLKDVAQRLNSDHLDFYLLTFLMEFYWAVNNPKLAEETAAERTKLVLKSAPLQSREMAGSVYADQAIAQTRVFNFADAQKSIRKSIDSGVQFGPTYNDRRDIELMTLLYQGKHKEAIKAANAVLDDTHPLLEAGLFAKRKYMKACALFMKGDHTACDDLLSSIKTFDKKHADWLAGLRVLGAINGIDHDLPGKAASGLEGLSKHMVSLRYKHAIRPRERVIHRILEGLAENEYDFKKTYKAHEIDFKLLGMTESQHRWNVLSHEVIIFQVWYDCKMKGKEFSFAVPKELQKEAKATEAKLDLV